MGRAEGLFKHILTKRGCVCTVRLSQGLKFYKQPERGSVLKRIRNGMPSIPFQDLGWVSVCSTSTCHCFAMPFVQWHHWDSEQWERTNKHTFPLSFLSLSRSHTSSWEATGMLCCIVGERESPLRFTASPWNAGTSKLRSAKKKWGCWLKGGWYENLKHQNDPQWDVLVVSEKEKGRGSWLMVFFLFYRILKWNLRIFTWISVCFLQADSWPGQLQSNPGFNRAGVQAIHFPIPPARPWTGKGRVLQAE